MVNPIATNPYAMNMRPQVTAVPMINMRIPPKPISVVSNDNQTAAISLDTATKQVQFFIENGQIVPKQTDLIYSRGVLIFYVDRRATTIKINDQLSQFSLTKLPQPIAGFEKLNKTRVDFKKSMKLRDEVFMLKSVVFSEVNIGPEGQETDVVVGSSAVVLKAKNEETEKGLLNKKGNELEDGVNNLQIVPIIYDPYSPVLVNPNSATRGPMHSLSYDYNYEDSNSFEYLAGNKGTIFIYKSVSEADGEKEIGL
jgi:hypothetical protein